MGRRRRREGRDLESLARRILPRPSSPVHLKTRRQRREGRRPRREGRREGRGWARELRRAPHFLFPLLVVLVEAVLHLEFRELALQDLLFPGSLKMPLIMWQVKLGLGSAI